MFNHHVCCDQIETIGRKRESAAEADDSGLQERVLQNRLIHVDANQEWDFAEAGPLFLQGHFVRRHYLPATSYIQPPGDTVKTPGQKARVMHLGVSYIQSQSSCNCQFPFSPKIHRGVPNCVPEFERE